MRLLHRLVCLLLTLGLANNVGAARKLPPGFPPTGGGGGGAGGEEEPPTDEPAREGSSQEIDPLIFAYEFAKVSDDSQTIARAVRAFRPFKNESLLQIVKAALEREPSRKDRERLLSTLEAKKREDDALVEQLMWKTSASVVRAGADIAARMGGKKSLDVLTKALRAGNIRENPYARAAVVEALGRHASESPKATKEIASYLLDYDDQDFAANGYRAPKDDKEGTPCVDVLVESARYFERRGTKDAEVARQLAELLAEAERPAVAPVLAKKSEAYRAGRALAAAAVAPAAADALLALTGTRFEPGAEGRLAALAHLVEHRDALGLS